MCWAEPGKKGKPGAGPVESSLYFIIQNYWFGPSAHCCEDSYSETAFSHFFSKMWSQEKNQSHQLPHSESCAGAGLISSAEPAASWWCSGQIKMRWRMLCQSSMIWSQISSFRKVAQVISSCPVSHYDSFIAVVSTTFCHSVYYGPLILWLPLKLFRRHSAEVRP